MEQSKPIDHKPAESDIGSKLISGEVVTSAIPGDRLPSYLRAALATGFKVKKIAGEGEEFPRLGFKNPLAAEHPWPNEGDERKVGNITVQGKGYIAVSIEKPEGKENHTPFWKNLESLKQEKA